MYGKCPEEFLNKVKLIFKARNGGARHGENGGNNEGVDFFYRHPSGFVWAWNLTFIRGIFLGVD